MDSIGAANLKDFYEITADEMLHVSEILSDMDAQLGDGDLGITMKKGFQALPVFIHEELENQGQEKHIGKCIMKSAVRMMSIVPSTMGTLMASGLMGAGRILEVEKKELIDAEGYVKYLKGFADGIANRGKCSPGDCTVLDAFINAYWEAKQCLEECKDADLEAVAKAARDGALAGAEATREMKPRFGKAAVFADKAVGKLDQGAYAGFCMIQGHYQYIIGEKVGGDC